MSIVFTTAIDINATPEEVWAVLTGLPSIANRAFL